MIDYYYINYIYNLKNVRTYKRYDEKPKREKRG